LHSERLAERQNELLDEMQRHVDIGVALLYAVG
jgi:hypothetical protein